MATNLFLHTILLLTDLGGQVSLEQDSPAVARHTVLEAVWRWGWARLEARYPHSRQGESAAGSFIRLGWRLLCARDSEQWGLAQDGAMRSVMCGR